MPLTVSQRTTKRAKKKKDSKTLNLCGSRFFGREFTRLPRVRVPIFFLLPKSSAIEAGGLGAQ